MSEKSTLPSLAAMCLEVPLYRKIEIGENSIEEFRKVILKNGKLDTYCLECRRESHFKGNLHTNFNFAFSGQGIDPLLIFIENGYFHHEFKCTRNQSHKLIFYFQVKDKTLSKIGQSPSIADLQIFDTQKYKRFLPTTDYQELTKAIGLNAHGIGIGSFVYLRRIFERLIESAGREAKQSSEWNQETWSKSRIREKIELLREYLPSFLVENKNLYGILSKGIHELSEDECRDAFPIVKLGIELILDEKIEQKSRRLKIEATSKSISNLHQKYSN